MAKDALRITDLRTDASYEIPIAHGTIPAMALREIKVDAGDFGLMTYDPAFKNTAACKSRITFIDGERGILRYRGYPIEQLAEKSSFEEVAYLLFEGELPEPAGLDAWRASVRDERRVPETLRGLYRGFGEGAHPMGVLMASYAALGTYHPDGRDVHTPENRRKQMLRLFAKTPLLGAFAFRCFRGLPMVDPDPELSYAGNFLRMVFAEGDRPYRPHPTLEKALDVLFTLHADHEQNCSASVMRGVGSSHADPYAAISGATAALWGPLHGGANEAVVGMLDEIGSRENIPRFIDKVKSGETRLMGFGHRVYKNYDPRAKIIKKLADEVFDVQGKNPRLEIALELERIALEDEYFVSRKLYPNVDFYSGLIYQSIGFPLEFFPVLFAIGRTPGWLAQWDELMGDSEQKIARPRQIYLGPDERSYPERG